MEEGVGVECRVELTCLSCRRRAHGFSRHGLDRQAGRCIWEPDRTAATVLVLLNGVCKAAFSLSAAGTGGVNTCVSQNLRFFKRSPTQQLAVSKQCGRDFQCVRSGKIARRSAI